MSTTTGSPGWITRSDVSWCGLAPFGPDPTMTKSTRTTPPPNMRTATAAPPPPLPRTPPAAAPPHPLPDPLGDAIDRLPSAPQLLDLVRTLAHPQLTQDVTGQ